MLAVVSVQWFGSEALELTYKTSTGGVANKLFFRLYEPRLDLVKQGRPWGFDGDGSLFRLVSDAQRISLRTYSIRCWRSTPRSSIRCRIKSHCLPIDVAAAAAPLLARR
jgi:hypothetical protein